MRHLLLRTQSFGKVQIIVRFASDPGSAARWIGDGQRNGKLVTFAQTVGEDQERGTFFIAEAGESKVEISYKPKQPNSQDAGILGLYRRASEGKLLQLAKQEFKAADDRLDAALKNATKTWQAQDKPALSEWKSQWPAIRQRWLDAARPAPSASPATAGATPPVSAEKDAAHWLALAQPTARGYYFIEGGLDPKASTVWNGEYDDFGGGHASLRLAKNGKLSVSLTFSRLEDTLASDITTTVPPERLTTAKNGDLRADFTFADPEQPDAAKHPIVSLHRTGHYLIVKVENADSYAKRGWFDGVYRAGPVPVE